MKFRDRCKYCSTSCCKYGHKNSIGAAGEQLIRYLLDMVFVKLSYVTFAVPHGDIHLLTALCNVRNK